MADDMVMGMRVVSAPVAAAAEAESGAAPRHGGALAPLAITAPAAATSLDHLPRDALTGAVYAAPARAPAAALAEYDLYGTAAQGQGCMPPPTALTSYLRGASAVVSVDGVDVPLTLGSGSAPPTPVLSAATPAAGTSAAAFDSAAMHSGSLLSLLSTPQRGGGGGGSAATASSAMAVPSPMGEPKVTAKELNVQLVCAVRQLNIEVHVQVAQVERLLSLGASANAASDDGNTCLHWSAWTNKPELARVLLAHRAHIALPNPEGRTAFHWACMSGALVIVAELLRAGADISAADGNGLQPIHLAAQYDRIETVALLRARGADINARDRNGKTCLLWAVELCLNNLANYLIITRADTFAADDEGRTAAHYCVVQQNSFLLQSLVEQRGYAGDWLHARDKHGLSPLGLAQMHGYSTMTQAIEQRLTDWKFRLRRRFLFDKTARLRGGTFVFLWVVAWLCIWQYHQATTLQPVSAFSPAFHFVVKCLTTTSLVSLMICHFSPPGFVSAPAAALSGSKAAASAASLPSTHAASPTNGSGASKSATATVSGGGSDPLSSSSAATDALVTAGGNFVDEALMSLSRASPSSSFWTEQYVRLLERGDTKRLCLTCAVMKPPRAKHCSTCDACVYRFDHHCIFVDNCVGERNHRSFLVFVWSTSAVALLYCANLTEYLWAHGVSGNAWTVVCALHAAWMTLMVTILAVVHLYLIARNLTTNEIANFDRYSYLKVVAGAEGDSSARAAAAEASGAATRRSAGAHGHSHDPSLHAYDRDDDDDDDDGDHHHGHSHSRRGGGGGGSSGFGASHAFDRGILRNIYYTFNPAALLARLARPKYDAAGSSTGGSGGSTMAHGGKLYAAVSQTDDLEQTKARRSDASSAAKPTPSPAVSSAHVIDLKGE